MKKIILLLTIMVFLVSCSNQKKKSNFDIAVHKEQIIGQPETTEVIRVEIEQSLGANKDNNLISKPKKETQNFEKKVVKKEKKSLRKETQIPLNNILDIDMDKQIEKEMNVTKLELPVEKNGKNKNIYGILGIILLIIGLLILKKKKNCKQNSFKET